MKQLCSLLLGILLFAPTLEASASVSRHHKHVRQHVKTSIKKPRAHISQLTEIEGFVVEDESGKILQSSNASALFNPASTLKLATSLMALRKYGPNAVLSTKLSYKGTVDKNGVLDGDVYVNGASPRFLPSAAMALAEALNNEGIKTIKGNLYVSSDFRLDHLLGLDAGQRLKSLWEARSNGRHKQAHTGAPEIALKGNLMLGLPAAGSNQICEMKFMPDLRRLLKVMLCFSINGLADELGAMMGGPKAVNDFIVETLHLDPSELSFSSASGLGINRISPAAMAKVLIALRAELKRNNYTLSDILPVAGIDPGTLEKRFVAADRSGTVVAKTGTLIQTDSGVSALAGEMKTKADGTLLFVIFQQHGSVLKFVKRQESLITQIQDEHGGPDKFAYVPLINSSDR